MKCLLSILCLLCALLPQDLLAGNYQQIAANEIDVFKVLPTRIALQKLRSAIRWHKVFEGKKTLVNLKDLCRIKSLGGVGEPYLDRIPHNPLMKNNASVSNRQDGTADWYYNAKTGVVEPGSKEIAQAVRINRDPIKMVKANKQVQTYLKTILKETQQKKMLNRLFQVEKTLPYDIWIPQVLYFMKYSQNRARPLLLHLFDSNRLDKHQFAYAIAPLFEAKNIDPVLLKNLAVVAEKSVITNRQQYRHYGDYLFEAGESKWLVSPKFIQHLIASNPYEGVEFVWAHFHKKGVKEPASFSEDITWSGHLVGIYAWRKEHCKYTKNYKKRGTDLRKETDALLKKLSSNHHWWVRLYVVEIFRTHLSLKSVPVLQTLSKDKNELVRKAAVSCLSKKKIIVP